MTKPSKTTKRPRKVASAESAHIEEQMEISELIMLIKQIEVRDPAWGAWFRRRIAELARDCTEVQS